MATADNQNPTPAAVQNETPATEPRRQRFDVQSWVEKYAFLVSVGLTVLAVGALATLFTQVVQMKEQIRSLQSDQVSSVALNRSISGIEQNDTELKAIVEALRTRTENLHIMDAATNNEVKDINNHVTKVEHELTRIAEIRERLAVIETTLKLLNQGEERKSSTPAVSTAR
jgi:hypothetical protein